MATISERPWGPPLAARLDGLSGSFEVGVHPGRTVGWRDRDRRAVLELAAGLGDEVELIGWGAL